MSAGALQTCAGHEAGSETAIHSMRAIFEDNNTHAALLVDATNAFNLVTHHSSMKCAMTLLLSLLYSHSLGALVPASAHCRDDARADIHARGF